MKYKISYIEAADNLLLESPEWIKLASKITKTTPDILVTNEMPFGQWLAASQNYEQEDAMRSVKIHEEGLKVLKALNIPIVLSSRPLFFNTPSLEKKLVNEGFALVDGEYKFAHQKHYFPQEPGFYEETWFSTNQKGFEPILVNGLSVGFMLCTEVMFNEWARHYRRQGAQLIIVPRASEASIKNWKTAASMAAIVSGCYVVSSNRVGIANSQLEFGGKGFAFAPDGTQISETSKTDPVVSFELDTSLVQQCQTQYPCYVSEIE